MRGKPKRGWGGGGGIPVNETGVIKAVSARLGHRDAPAPAPFRSALRPHHRLTVRGRVDAGLATAVIRLGATVERVVTGTTRDGVVPGLTMDAVRAALAGDDVAALVPVDEVRPVPAVQQVRGVVAQKDVVVGAAERVLDRRRDVVALALLRAPAAVVGLVVQRDADLGPVLVVGDRVDSLGTRKRVATGAIVGGIERVVADSAIRRVDSGPVVELVGVFVTCEVIVALVAVELVAVLPAGERSSSLPP